MAFPQVWKAAGPCWEPRMAGKFNHICRNTCLLFSVHGPQTNKQINQDFIGGKFTIFLPDHCKKVSFFEGPQAVLYSLPSPHLLFSADPETAGIGVFHQVLVLVVTHAGNSVARASSGGQSWETNNAPALHGSRGCFHAAMIPQDHAIVWVGRDLVNHPGPTPWLGTPSTRAGFWELHPPWPSSLPGNPQPLFYSHFLTFVICKSLSLFSISVNDW